MANQIQLAAAGDAMITRSWSSFDSERINPIVSAFQTADVSIANLEMIFHDFESPPAVTGPGVKMRASPDIAEELEWAGFDLLTVSNNHVMDYSHGGMQTTMETLENHGIAYAGLGENLADARAPAYIETPVGRVALVSACSTIVSGSEAGAQRRDMRGRPGIAPLRLETRYVVSEERFEHLRGVIDELGMTDIKRRYDELGGVSQFKGTIDDNEALRFLNMGVGSQSQVRFEVGDNPGIYQRPVRSDVDAFLKQLRIADRTADWVVASLHAHEGQNGRLNDETVPPFIETFAKECVDAGADLFHGHGPHQLRGMEVYDGAPLFYSLGNLFMEPETITRLPAEIYEWYGLEDDATASDVFDQWGYDEDGNRIGFLANRKFWQSVVPICELGPDGVESIDLLPISMGFERSRSTRGTPVLAEGTDTDQIIKHFADLSKQYGTKVESRDDKGVVTV